MKGKRIPFLTLNTSIPVIKLRLEDNTECVAIIDSGSDATVYDLDFVRNHKNLFSVKKTTNKANYIGVNSSSTHPIIYCQAKLHYSDSSFICSGELFDLSVPMYSFNEEHAIKPNMILGSEFLKTVDAKIDYENDELVLGNDLLGK